MCDLSSKKFVSPVRFHLVEFSNSTFSDHMKSPWEKPITINLVY